MRLYGAFGDRRVGWGHRVAQHPEWWCVALSAAAWLWLVSGAGHGGERAHATQGHHHHAGTVQLEPEATVFGWLPEMHAWTVMVVAMMIPLVLGPIVATAARSLWHRRARAVAGFLLGHLGLWVLCGAVALGAVVALDAGGWLREPLAVAAGFAVAAAWQCSPAKRRMLRSCHLTVPLAPRGWRADRDCIRYGWLVGERCLLSCWALMLVCVLTGHSLIAMIGVSLVALTERYRYRPDQRLNAALLAGVAIVHLSVA